MTKSRKKLLRALLRKLTPEMMGQVEDARLIGHLKEVHVTHRKPIAEMWPPFQERLIKLAGGASCE